MSGLLRAMEASGLAIISDAVPPDIISDLTATFTQISQPQRRVARDM